MLYPILSLFLLRPPILCRADKPLAAKIHAANLAHAQAFQTQRIENLAALATSSASASNGGSTPASSLPVAPTSNANSHSASKPAASGSISIFPSAPVVSVSGSANASSIAISASAILATALPAATAAVSFQIYTSDELPTSLAPPAACASALTASIACNDTIQLLGGNPWFDGPSLTAICTSTCMNSLASYRSAVVKACGTYMIPGPNNVTYAPTLAVDTISGPYAVQCRQDATTDEFCNEVLSGFGPTPAQGILGYPTNELCSSCMLGTLNSTLSNPITFYPDFYATLQSALKICGSSFNAYNVTPSPNSGPLFVSTGPSTAPSGSNDTVDTTCALTGRNVTTTASQTCTDIASNFSVGWYDILSNNPAIQTANCTAGIRSGTTLCLPQACTTYTPTTNQTCEDIVAAGNKILASSNQSITTTQLVSFNPSLDTGCVHVSRQWGLSLCITPHGGFPDVSAAGLNAQPPVPSPTAIVPPPGSTPPGTTSNCGAWYFVQPGDFCTKVALNNSITLDDLITLNPMLNEECTNLWASTWYCVAAYPALFGGVTTISATGVFAMTTIALPSATPDAPYAYPTGYVPAPPNVANGTITTGCQSWYTVQAGDNCTSIEELYEINDANFTTYNFDSCPSLVVGSAVCVLVTNVTQTIPPVPANAAKGSGPNGCMRWYTIVEGDTCPTVEAMFALTQSELFILNPELTPACTNLALGESYCVHAVPGAPASTGPPLDLEPGSWSNCTTYYTVQSGDNCNLIEAKYNISFSDFLHWNPEVTTTCSNLALASYCVGISGGCQEIYTVASGDSCGTIESKASVSDATLRALNPWIDTKCDIQIGQAICIKNSNVFPPPTGPPANLEPGSWSNCSTYYNVQSGDSCNLIESQFGISFSDLLHWNPEITTSCSNLALASYCVGTTGGCQQVYTVVSGDSCGTIESKMGVSDATLKALNPWIDVNCAIQVGQAICVKNSNVVSSGPPSNLSPGSWSNCTTYYNVQSGDNCNVIETKFKISFSDFLRWNPEVTTTCSNLILASYCVGVAGGCSELYTVVSGDSCGGIESKVGISDAQLHTKNTWINSGCSNIQPGQNLCV
ncbi:hypothetical protein MVEN_01130000 [Mycena venus]|uniref:LysM domain-containing protein n=1 Tax=Mycena venus TaxID=2733690 RepID=A0A8H6YAA3_9AGAR|nr:hypothetical protein MVEN_01130000 [Mycena venus]